jgi:hypothetical protein
MTVQLRVLVALAAVIALIAAVLVGQALNGTADVLGGGSGQGGHQDSMQRAFGD